MVRFLHAADLHLDSSQPRGLVPYDGAPIEACRDSTRKALKNLVQWAIREAVDFVLIAGDVYDGDWRDVRTGLFFVDQLRQLRDAGIACYMIRGNHDAASEISRDLPLPLNPDGSPMLLSHEQCDSVRLEELGVVVHGRGFATRSVKENLATRYPAATKGYVNIGMLHTCLEGAEGHDPYAPCTREELLAKGYDYWALGHIHHRGLTQHVPGETPILFSGNLQGRHVRECGAKGAYEVVIDRGQTSVTFHAFEAYQWQIVTLDVRDASDEEELFQWFYSELQQRSELMAHKPLALRLELCGATALHARLHQKLMALTDQFKSVANDAGRGQIWLEEIRLKTCEPQVKSEGHRDDGAIGEMLEIVDRLKSQPEPLSERMALLQELARRLPHGLAAEEVFRPDDPHWIREMLEELKPFLISRLQTSGKP